MITDKEKLKARMQGATAALENKKLDANPYEEHNELHFVWLEGWTWTRTAILKQKK